MTSARPGATTTGGGADADPSGCPVAGGAETVALDRGLDQMNRMEVARLPVAAQTSGHLP